MIEYKNLKKALLKAIINNTNVTPVKVLVHGQHGSYMSTRYKSTGSDTKSDNRRISQQSKDKVAKYFKTFSSHDKFFEELKQMGITWNENKNPGINLMFAKMALGKAIDNGFDINNPKSAQTAQSAQLATIAQPAKPQKSKKILLSDSSKKKTNEFYETVCNKDKDKFFTALKAMGITWNENKNPGINFMFAKMALSEKIELGFDPNNPSSVKPKSSAELLDESLLEIPADATEREKVLIGYINKLTNIEDIQSCARVGIVPEDNRAKAFIIDKLQARLGLAVANPDNDEWFRDVDKKGNVRFPKELRESIKQSWGTKVLSDLANGTGIGNYKGVKYDKSPVGFGKSFADQLNLDGCKKSSISKGFERAANFNMQMLVNPRKTISNIGNNLKPIDIIRSLNEGYSDYTSDDFEGYLTNLGYTGYDPAIYRQRYSLEKEGVVKYLDNLKSNNPEFKNDVDSMISDYDSMMKIVGYNPHVLNLVLSYPNWSTESFDNYKLSNFGKKIPDNLPDAHKAIEFADKLSDLVINELEKRGYSQKSILDALKNSEINDALNCFEIKNDSGKTDVIDFTKLKNPDGTNAIVVRRSEHEWGSGMLAYTQAKYMRANNIPYSTLDSDNLQDLQSAVGFYNLVKQITEITPEDYKKVNGLALKMFGIKYIDSSGKDIDYSTANTEKAFTWKIPGSKQVNYNDSPHMDLILSNMIIGKVFHDVNSDISSAVTNNAVSNLNDNGKDYSKNFDYYSGSVMSTSGDLRRITQLGSEEAVYTADQLSSKIKNQLSQVPIISSDYQNKLKSYYSATTKNPVVDSFKSGWGYSSEVYLDSPLKDFMYRLAENVSSHVPHTVKKPTYSKLTAKRLNYVPFDFSITGKQPTLSKEKPIPRPNSQELKAARMELLAAATCSLQTTSEQETREMWKTMREKDFDYKLGEKTLGGMEMRPVHAIHDKTGKRITTQGYDDYTLTHNRTLLLNAPFFKVNNSTFHEKFVARKKKIIESKLNSECSDTLNLYTGTSYWSAANILREGKFYINAEVQKVGSMLGSGVYVSDKVGKNSPYIGNVAYSSEKDMDLSKEQADGILMMVDVMKGERFIDHAYPSDVQSKLPKTFLARDATDPDTYIKLRKGLRDWEGCVKENDLIDPQYLVDLSSREYTTNVNYDDSGYHNKTTNELTHDTDGINVNIQWGEN